MTDEAPTAPPTPPRDPRLGRRPQFDERSRAFAVAPPAPTRPLRSYTWTVGVWLDQGQSGGCTGYSRAHHIAARPAPRPMTNADADQLYRRARQLDDFPGEDDTGSSVLAAAKAAQERGLIGPYSWSFSIEQLAAGVGYDGPAVLGIDWLEGMENTDQRGFIHATGQTMGGHAILCNAVDVKGRTFGLHNSWGAQWGVGGTCRISWSDLDMLLHRQGEASFAKKPAPRRARPARTGDQRRKPPAPATLAR